MRSGPRGLASQFAFALAATGKIANRIAKALTLRAAPNMQHSLAEAADEMVRYVRRKDSVQVVKRCRRYARKLVSGSPLRPASAYLEPLLTLVLHTYLRSPEGDPGVLGARRGHGVISVGGLGGCLGDQEYLITL